MCVHTGLPRKIDSQQRLHELRQPALQGLEERAFQVDGAGRVRALAGLHQLSLSRVRRPGQLRERVM